MMNVLDRKTALLSIFLIGIVGTVPIKALADYEGVVVSIQSENDLYLGNGDRWYTNGGHGKILMSAGARPDLLSWTERLIPSTSGNGAADSSVRFFIGAGQNMYTPEDLARSELIISDRPYAGWLYGEIGAIGARNQMQEIVTVSLGIIGPWSLAEEAQEFIHELSDSIDPQGWSNQLRNEPALLIGYQRAWFLPITDCERCDFTIEFSPRIGGAVGNVRVNAGAGAVFRLGSNLPNSLPPRSRPGMTGLSALAGDRFGWHLFAGLEGRAVARDIFLDGNTFRKSHSVAKENIVYEFQSGGGISFSRFAISMSFVIRSKEFKLQPEKHKFGSINLSVGF